MLALASQRPHAVIISAVYTYIRLQQPPIRIKQVMIQCAQFVLDTQTTEEEGTVRLQHKHILFGTFYPPTFNVR
jgi:hypothetical protein